MNKYLTISSFITLFFLCTIQTSSQWVHSPIPFGVRYFYNSGEKIYAGCQGGIYISSNNGATWDSLGLPSCQVYSIVAFKSNIFVGTYDGNNGSHVFHSSDSGKHWIPSDSGLNPTPVKALAVMGNNILAGQEYGGMFVSSDEGKSWNVVNTGLSKYSVNLFALSGNSIYAATDSFFTDLGCHLIKSIDNGNTWSTLKWSKSKGKIYSLTILDSIIFVGTAGGIFRSTNNGDNWIRIDSGMTIDIVNALATSENYVFAGTYSHGVYFSKDKGISWSPVDSGFFYPTKKDSLGPVILPPQVQALGISGSNLLAGIWNGGTLSISLSKIVTMLYDNSKVLPAKYILTQNYPNPFNPSTTISFTLPSNSFVTLKIYDLEGKEVATLVNRDLVAGVYTKQWNAVGMASGVYFYRLSIEGFTETKKIILLR